MAALAGARGGAACQQRFHLVRQLGHIGEAEGGGAALMECAQRKMALSSSSSGGIDVHIEQRELFHVVQVLTGFFKEDLVELAEVDASADVCARGHIAPSLRSGGGGGFGITLPMTSIGLGGGRKGFDEPAGGAMRTARLLHRVAGLGGQDQDGRGLNGFCAQLLGQADAVHAGMFWSGQHQVEVARAGLLHASWPSTASTTLKPAFLSVNATICRMEAESSTARMECMSDFSWGSDFVSS